MRVKTAAWFAGYVTMVHPWRLAECPQFLIFGDHFGGQYCPVEFEVCNDAV